PTRQIGPFYQGKPDPEASLFFWNENTSKRSVVLDLEVPEGQATLRRLAAVADFLIETHPRDFFRERGLDYETLSRDNPGLIQVSITGFGQSGPYAGYKTPEIVAWAMSGFMSRCGAPDREPLMAGTDPGRHVAGIYGAIGALAALERRSRTGRGGYLDISAQEAIASVTEGVHLAYIHANQITRRNGSEYSFAVPLKIFPCLDGQVLVVTVTVGQWQKLVELMLLDDQADDLIDPKWEDNLLRIAERDHIHGLIGRWVATKRKHEFVAYAQANRLPFAVVNAVEDASQDPQLEALGFYVEVEHPDVGRSFRYPGTPARSGLAGRRTVRRAPKLGEHQGAIEEWIETSPPALLRGGAGSTKEGPGGEVLPLAGLRVIDFTWAAAGPFAAKTLADLGADVVKIEQPEVGDLIRFFPPFPKGEKTVNGSGYHYQINRNKRTMCVNLRSEAGKDLIRRLAAHADVMIDNFSAGVLARLGLDYDQIKAVNPRIIVMHLPAFGEVGPRKDYVGFAPTIEAFSGLSALTGYPDTGPTGMGVALPDYWGGLSGALASLAALIRFERTGQGERVDAPMFASNTSILGPVMLDFTVNGRAQTPQGNRRTDRPAAPHGLYRCAGDDRWIAIAVETDEEWRSLRRVMGDPTWARDERWESAEGRFAGQADLDRQIEAWTSDQEPRALMERLQAAAVPAGMFQNARDLVDEDPHLAARGFFVEVDHPEIGRSRLDRSPILIDGHPLPIRRRAPLLMEHGEEVIAEWLEVPADEAALLAAQALFEE
ncbi:MAG TPA: CoA transferase, partial [Dehalococcoidia bacterium]|nr:CoA transferase [Dehalococcoidia bacterium]